MNGTDHAAACAREMMLAHRFEENVAAVRRLLAVRDLVAQRRSALMRAGTAGGRARVAALSEVAAESACTMHMAEVYEGIGELLGAHMPAVRDTALAGAVGYQQLAVVYHSLAGVDVLVVRELDDEIAAAARQMAPGSLGREVERLLLAVDPDMADRLHERERVKRHVSRTRRRSGMADVKAYVTADEAVAVDGAIDAVAGTVCRDDPRTASARRADALVAMANGSDALECRCGRDGCDAARRRDSGGGGEAERVRVHVHADLATLAHLTDSPGYLEGYGPIAADYARMLAESGRWQVVFAEAWKLAECWLAARDEDGVPRGGDVHGCAASYPGADGDWAARGDPGSKAPDAEAPEALDAEAPDAETPGEQGPDPEESNPEDPAPEAPSMDRVEPDPELDDPAWWDYIEAEMRRYEREQRGLQDELAAVGRCRPGGPVCVPEGAVRPAPPMPLRYGRVGVFAPVPVIGRGRLIEAIRAQVAARPEFAVGVFSDGHGGYAHAPDGALRYRPSARVRRAVRVRDGHCRFPGCLVDAARCEIDHVVPFEHDDPAGGGWSVPENLHCLCKQHHQLKTQGIWRVAVLAGYAECWTSTVSGRRMIGVPGGFAARAAPPKKRPGRFAMRGRSTDGAGDRRSAGSSPGPSARAVAFGPAEPAGGGGDSAEPAPF